MDYFSKTKLAADKIIKEIIEEDGKLNFPVDPFRILKSKNVVITFSDFDKLEGLLLFASKHKSVVSINMNRPVTRQRFTAAHELGHILLHSEVKGDKFFCPIASSKSLIEKEADDFASNLLMPTDELNKIVNKYQNSEGTVGLDECLLISEYFGVSFESCVKTICFRLNRYVQQLNNVELSKEIKKYKPTLKRQELVEHTNDLKLLVNCLNYSSFSLVNVNNIIGIKFLQNLVYHDSHLENIELSMEEIAEIYADFRLNGSNSKYCKIENKDIIEVLGNIEMNKYCLTTKDEISIFKIQELNKLLYKYVPFPEYTGLFRNEDNLISNGTIQPVTVSELFTKLEELNALLIKVINNIEKYSFSEYICEVAKIHYKLIVLHPFNDGNGRVARAFMNWLLRLKGLSPIYIDSNNRDAYLSALKKIDGTQDSTDLQILIIKSIIKTMAELHNSWQ